ncbi:NAD(P)/FAD-dependent oxidoreductase [Streptomyces sp. XD-27]|uniref:FAD-dependent oxidoreductase n=1 Tax=Streptomyces sp. XD-27 TaxID=3062779 RepID=UPI0026F42124|nr:NAD(P)/FAD-dependent oxidoreductase [Streptomyces sp. XD-27]WKX68780.1 NAD(P)/FAD-dependent oxidoreductase [Streptomyces sp. XD-27]
MSDTVIIGGGIAGVVAAIALRKAGIRATVYESRPPGAADAGAFLVLFAGGLEALRSVDAHRAVLARSFPAHRVHVVGSTGRRLGSRTLAGDGGGAPAPRTLRRAALDEALREEAARRGVRIEYGKRFVAAHIAPDGRIVASFADGGRAQADVLIGADGIHSVTRKFIDAASPRPRYTGLNTVCGYTRDLAAVPEPSRPEPGAYTMVCGKQAFFGCTVAPDGAIWWFAHVPGPELPRTGPPSGTGTLPAPGPATTPEQWRGQVAGYFDDDGTAGGIVRAAADVAVGSAYDLAATPAWSGDAMVLIGDAAHASAPGAAQGASLAVEDAVVLATCLRDLPARRAFAAYERLRRPRVERVAAAGAAMARRTAPGRVGRVLRDTLLTRRLDRGGAGADDWLTGYRVDWDGPVRDRPLR